MIHKVLFIESKKFYLDIINSSNAKLMKITEVSLSGKRFSMVMRLETASTIQHQLGSFAAYATVLDVPSLDLWKSNNTLMSRRIFSENRKYFLDLINLSTGLFLRIAAKRLLRDKSQVLIPASGIEALNHAVKDMLFMNGFSFEDYSYPKDETQTDCVSGSQQSYFGYSISNDPKKSHTNINTQLSKTNKQRDISDDSVNCFNHINHNKMTCNDSCIIVDLVLSNRTANETSKNADENDNTNKAIEICNNNKVSGCHYFNTKGGRVMFDQLSNPNFLTITQMKPFTNDNSIQIPIECCKSFADAILGSVS